MTTSTYLGVPELAKRLGVDSAKIRAWIRNGEIAAINVAFSSTGRPRWKISPEAIEAFERRRASTPAPKISRIPRRKLPQAREWF